VLAPRVVILVEGVKCSHGRAGLRDEVGAFCLQEFGSS
jgi:hypothetical protein